MSSKKLLAAYLGGALGYWLYQKSQNASPGISDILNPMSWVTQVTGGTSTNTTALMYIGGGIAAGYYAGGKVLAKVGV